LGGLWALECVRSSGICTPNLNSLALIVSEISAFIRTDIQTDMARSTPLVILSLLPVTYFSTNLVYPFTLRVTGIKMHNSACYILSDESSIPFYSTSNGYKNFTPHLCGLFGKYCRRKVFIFVGHICSSTHKR